MLQVLKRTWVYPRDKNVSERGAAPDSDVAILPSDPESSVFIAAENTIDAAVFLDVDNSQVRLLMFLLFISLYPQLKIHVELTHACYWNCRTLLHRHVIHQFLQSWMTLERVHLGIPGF